MSTVSNGYRDTLVVARFCPYCGAASTPEGAYCPACGTQLAQRGEPLVERAATASSLSRRWRAPLIGLALLVAVALGAVALLRARAEDDRPAVDLAALVSTTAGPLADSAETVADARDVSGLASAGRRASDQTAGVTEALPDARRVEQPAEREALRRAAEAAGAVTTAFNALGELSTDDLSSWEDVRAALATAAAEIEDADEALLPLGHPGFGGAAEALDEARANAEDVVGRALFSLAGWRAEVERVEAERDLQLLGLAAYEDAVRDQDTRYLELRGDLQRFADRLDVEALTYGEVYSELSAATSGREGVRDRLRDLAPPPAVTAAHAALVGVVDRAVAGVRSATEGVRQYEYDWDYVWYEDTPGWQTFMATSADVSRSRESAMRAWSDAVDAERARLESMKLPEAPKV